MANRSDQFNHTKPIVFNERCVWINAETWMKRYISFQRCYCCCCFINLAVVFQMGYSQERKKNQQPGLFQCGSTVIESLSTSHVHNHFDSINHLTGMVAADSVQIICESLTLTSFFHYSLIHARISLLISLSHPMTKSTPHIWLCEKSCFCLFPVNECCTSETTIKRITQQYGWNGITNKSLDMKCFPLSRRFGCWCCCCWLKIVIAIEIAWATINTYP